MITSQKAQDLVLNLCNSKCYNDKFIVYFCELSLNQDYWIIRCNSERYILNNSHAHCYVGVNAYLVNTLTGEIEIVSSAHSIDDFLQDKSDLQRAGQCFYILQPTFTKENKQALINLKQWLGCGYTEALSLLSLNNNKWFTGKLRYLQHIQALLKNKNIKTEISLIETTDNAVVIEPNILYEEDIKKELNKFICLR